MTHKWVDWRLVSDLKPYPKNARTHSKKQIRKIAESIREFGWTNPILIDAEEGIIAGHGRVEAAKLMDLEQVPTLQIDHLTEKQKRAYIMADNRLAELAGWDIEILATELQFLTTVDLDFDISIIGFETAEIDLMIEGLDLDADHDEADEIPQKDLDSPIISRPGDLWNLGNHRILCADATDDHSFDTLLAGEKARMIFTDPPFNVPVDGHVCGSGRIKHDNFAMASGEMSEAQFAAFLQTVLGHLSD
ncbi:MAG: ParB N-terminal domain-containing protein, partial [Candidatus Brocadiales bacterium]|nr:ParB N-terminal domain-containing protein [Candidatus Bathyanammoxibius sp.]